MSRVQLTLGRRQQDMKEVTCMCAETCPSYRRTVVSIFSVRQSRWCVILVSAQQATIVKGKPHRPVEPLIGGITSPLPNIRVTRA